MTLVSKVVYVVNDLSIDLANDPISGDVTLCIKIRRAQTEDAARIATTFGMSSYEELYLTPESVHLMIRNAVRRDKTVITDVASMVGYIIQHRVNSNPDCRLELIINRHIHIYYTEAEVETIRQALVSAGFKYTF